MSGAVDYPRFGPLLATAFDKAVRLTLGSWPWIVIIILTCAAAASVSATQAALNVCLFVWTFAAAANAMRTINPEYRMSGGTVGSMFLAAVGVGLAFFFGFIALVWPGLYLSTKWSMAQAAVVADGVPAEVGMRRSWELTAGRFWHTFLFFAVLLIAVEATVLIPSVVIGGFAGVLVSLKVLPVTLEMATNIGIALVAPIAMYVTQAQWIAGLYWYVSLKAMHQAEVEAQAVPLPVA